MRMHLMAACMAALALTACTPATGVSGGDLFNELFAPPVAPADSPKLNSAQNVVFVARAGYDVALSAAAAYRALPACGTTASKICSAPAIVAKIKTTDAAVEAAFDNAESIAAANPTLDSTSLLQGVTVLTASVAQILVENKIGAAQTIAQSASAGGDSTLVLIGIAPQLAGDAIDAGEFGQWAVNASKTPATKADLDNLHALESTVRAQLAN